MTNYQTIRRFQIRKQRGVTTMALVLVIAFFVILPLTLLGFEISRFILIQSQLQNITDAAALTGTAALASSPPGTIAQRHLFAMQSAYTNFGQNSILSTGFLPYVGVAPAGTYARIKATYNTGPDWTVPPPYNATVNITLKDQNGVLQPTNSPTATTMHIDTIYSDSPIFTTFFGSKVAANVGGIETAYASSDGGLPQLDLFLCFDVSGSMDDQTPVLFVNRYWTGANVTCQACPLTGGATNSIFDQTRPAITGTALNLLPPQNLSYASYGNPSNLFPHIWSESPAPIDTSLNGLRINQFTYPAGSLPAPLTTATKYPLGGLVPEQGIPPGNYDPTNPTNSKGNGLDPTAHGASGYTDMIMQTPFTSNGFNFATPAIAVEAARGNLESIAILKQSQANTTNPQLAGAAPGAGWYAAYWAYVEKNAQPIADARTAAVNFFDTMNLSSNAHFGLDAFSDTAGTSSTTTWPTTVFDADANYSFAGTVNPGFPVPLLQLVQSASNYPTVDSVITGTGGTFPSGAGGTLPLSGTGHTNIADSLKEAITALTNPALVRPQAKKAIILFTDGIPDRPLPNGFNAAMTQAGLANAAKIPIYTIGLSQNGTIIPQMRKLLGDGVNYGTTQGIAKTSGYGATYTEVTNSANLNAAFQSIARSLVVLQ